MINMQEKQYFIYGEKEIAYLKSKDPILGNAIEEIGYIEREIIPDIFMALIHVIIGQQISTKAHTTVWERFQNRFAPITPKRIRSFSAEELQTCGMTMKKASYIKKIADDICDGTLNVNELSAMCDADVCKQLCRIHGVGMWTAEMLMTFSMQRMDIISYGDLAILRGMRMLYRHRKITPKLFEKYKKRYSPYASVASLYLWEIAGGECEGFTDPASGAVSKKQKK